MKAHEAREVARADSLLDDVRKAEGRAERLLEVAEDILEKAREAEDLKTAIGAIRAAAHAMAERRQFMELRGELTGELPNVAGAAANVTLVKVLSVPRLPGVPQGYARRTLERRAWSNRRSQNHAGRRRWLVRFPRSNRRTFPQEAAFKGGC